MRLIRNVPDALEQDGVGWSGEDRQAGSVESAGNQSRSIRGRDQLQGNPEEFGNCRSQRIDFGEHPRRSRRN